MHIIKKLNYIMKKLALLLLTAFLAVSCGCNNVSEINYPDTFVNYKDYQYSFCDKSTGEFIIQKCNGGYYFYLNNFIYFADEKSMHATPLCNKSDCLHDKETDMSKMVDCNAFFSNPLLNSEFFYYNNKLYTFSDESYYEGKNLIVLNSIYKTDPDGSNKEKLFTIDYNISKWFIHRDKLYYTSDQNDSVFKYDLSNNKTDTVLKLSVFGLYNTTLENMFAYGNNLYFYISGYKSKDEFNSMLKGENIEPFEYWYVININDGSNYKISSSLSRSGLIFEGFENDNFLYSEANYNDLHPQKTLYSVDSHGNKTKSDFTYENLFDRYYADDKFIYEAKAITLDDVEKNIFYIYDKNNNLLTKIDFPDGYVNSLYLGDENYLFYREENENVQRLYYISKKDLSSGNATLKILYEMKN